MPTTIPSLGMALVLFYSLIPTSTCGNTRSDLKDHHEQPSILNHLVGHSWPTTQMPHTTCFFPLTHHPFSTIDSWSLIMNCPWRSLKHNNFILSHQKNVKERSHNIMLDDNWYVTNLLFARPHKWTTSNIIDDMTLSNKREIPYIPSKKIIRDLSLLLP